MGLSWKDNNRGYAAIDRKREMRSGGILIRCFLTADVKSQTCAEIDGSGAPLLNHGVTERTRRMRCGNDVLWTAQENAKDAFPSSSQQYLDNPKGYPHSHNRLRLTIKKKSVGKEEKMLASPDGEARISKKRAWKKREI